MIFHFLIHHIKPSSAKHLTFELKEEKELKEECERTKWREPE